jgi:predicted MFS family arabinose efflux permease
VAPSTITSPRRAAGTAPGSGTTPASRGRGRLPLVVYVLAAGTVLMGATEFMIAGLLPEMASDLAVSESTAGLLITAFAAGMIIGSPAMALLTLRLPRRASLTLALAVFAAAHVIVAVSSSFALVLAARVLTAFATGAFWAIASVAAAAAAGPAARTRALGVVGGGLTLANVIGVPLGSWIGQAAGWRSPFWILAAAAATAAILIGRFIPHEGQPTPPPRGEFAALRQARLWLPLAAAALIMGGVLACYSYISPLLTGRAGIPATAVPLVLAGFGIGALIGTNTGGRLGDRRPTATALTGAAATALVLLAMALLPGNAVAAVILVALMGLTGFTVNPVVGSLAVRLAGNAPTLTAALTVSAFNTGIAVGTVVAGVALTSPLGLTGPALTGAAITALTVVPLSALRHQGVR